MKVDVTKLNDYLWTTTFGRIRNRHCVIFDDTKWLGDVGTTGRFKIKRWLAFPKCDDSELIPPDNFIPFPADQLFATKKDAVDFLVSLHFVDSL